MTMTDLDQHQRESSPRDGVADTKHGERVIDLAAARFRSIARSHGLDATMRVRMREEEHGDN